MKVAWLLGWAVPEAWFAAIVCAAAPTVKSVFFSAEPDALDRLEQHGKFDAVVGYSLGSHLLLCERERASRLGEIALLAPIFAFVREENLGGRIVRTQVRYLARWLRIDPVTALADFYARAGLDVLPSSPLPSTATLTWGLEQLEQSRAELPLPDGWRAWCGADDALLDASGLAQLAPGLEVVAGATHHPARLIEAWAKGRA